MIEEEKVGFIIGIKIFLIFVIKEDKRKTKGRSPSTNISSNFEFSDLAIFIVSLFCICEYKRF